MPEFIVSWSPYGPSGRIQAASHADAVNNVAEDLRFFGLATEVIAYNSALDQLETQWDGHCIIIRSPVKRYGDMGSFIVCVYAVGERSFYDVQREQIEAKKAQEVSDAHQISGR